jgi:hypothetical protein
LNAICPVCGGIKNNLILTNVKSIYAEFSSNVFQCFDCKHGFTYPKPPSEIVKKIYERSYSYSFHKLLDSEKRNRSFKLLKIIKKVIDIDGLIEVGSMHGIFLQAARDLGIRTLGIEINDEANQTAIGNKLQTLSISAEEFSIKKINFSANTLVLIHTLEHLENPRLFIKNVYINHPNIKYLIFVVPNFESINRRIFKKNWGSLQIGTHYHHFTRKSIRKLLESSSFSELKVINRGGDFNLFAVTIINLFNIKLGKAVNLKKLAKLLIDLICKMLNVFYKFGNDEIVVIYERSTECFNYNQDKF